MTDDRKKALLILSVLRTYGRKGSYFEDRGSGRDILSLDFSTPAEQMLTFEEMTRVIDWTVRNCGPKTSFALLLGVPEKSRLSGVAIAALAKGNRYGSFEGILPENLKNAFDNPDEMEETIKTQYSEAYEEFKKWVADPAKYFKNDLTKKQLEQHFNPSQLRVLAEVADGEIGRKASELGMEPIRHAERVIEREQERAAARSSRLFE